MLKYLLLEILSTTEPQYFPSQDYTQCSLKRIYLHNLPLKTHLPATTDTFIAACSLSVPSHFMARPSGRPNCKFLHKASKTQSIIHPKCHSADDNSPDMNYKWELPPPACVLDPLPCSTPMTSLFLKLVTVIPAETGGCWAIGCYGPRCCSTQLLAVGLTMASTLILPNRFAWRELKLEVEKTSNELFEWNLSAIWIPSSCSSPTCSVVWHRYFIWILCSEDEDKWCCFYCIIMAYNFRSLTCTFWIYTTLKRLGTFHQVKFIWNILFKKS